ncbi:MAG: hypothetical protein R3277_02435 [Brumimicrobium sp.]|nr:hypothetical protein [Brumimicrobium sp.]
MKSFIAILGLFFVCNNSNAQEFKAEISYKYIYSSEWDKAIRAYNFSRPFISEKQPLLMHGLNSSVSYIFESQKKFQQGIHFSYSYFRSSANNENLDNVLNLHFLNLGYLIHYENKEKLKGFYTDLIISVSTSGLFRKVNGESFEYDDSKSKALGIGGNLDLKAGYLLRSKGNFHLSPFISIGYSPYFYSPNTEVVINQTKGLINNNWTPILSAQVGLTFHTEKR